jgi:hypothetical protein
MKQRCFYYPTFDPLLTNDHKIVKAHDPIGIELLAHGNEQRIASSQYDSGDFGG